MYAKLLIKLYIVLFVINFVLIGFVLDSQLFVYLSLLNVVALFIVLFQHSRLFTSMPGQERVLFSADVFAFLAIWFGVFGTYFFYPEYAHVLQHTVVSILILGGFFYLGTIWLFRMVEIRRWNHRSVNLLAGLLIILFVMIEGSWLYSTYGNLLGDYGQAVESWTRMTMSQLTTALPVADQLGTTVRDDRVEIDQGTEVIGPTGGDLPIQETLTLPGESLVGEDRLFVTDYAGDEILTYGTFLPVLKETYNLPTLDGSVLFTYVPISDQLYPAFQSAYAKRMIGSTTNPATELRCGNLMVILGLAEGREVAYAPATIIPQYWTEAVARGYTDYGCESPTQFATWSTLP